MHDLNPPQREAVRYLDGPLLVLAGAGSGKTRVITEKIVHLVETCGTAPQHVFAITFTNKAAREMRERVVKRAGEGVREVAVSTFHALGASFLRQEARCAGLKPGFSIVDASDSAALLQDLLKDAARARVNQVRQRISLWKNALIEPARALDGALDAEEAEAARAYGDYEKALRAYQALDFDDLIRLPVRLLESDETVAQRWRSRVWHLLVDEYQDTNHCQNRLLRLLVGERAAFTAVGDDDQSIYAWRGADVGGLQQLQQDFPRLKVIKLEQNYRSTTHILQAANRLIAHNPKLFEKKLWSDRGCGEPIRVMACRDDAHEAQWVVTRLMAHRFETRGRWRDYAILYRGNHQARRFEEVLRAHQLPYVMSGGASFFDKSEIKDVVAWLRLLANHDDDPAFIRAATTPRRGIGRVSLEALGEAASRRRIGLFAAIFAPGVELEIKAAPLSALRAFGDFINRMAVRARQEAAGVVLEELLRGIAYEAWLFESLQRRDAGARWANVREFSGWLATKGEAESKGLLELTQSIALAAMLDKNEEGAEAADAVQLATLHAAKGLEFRHVFLVGVEEGALPHREAADNGDVSEERRLMYVGVTRARMSLNISWCARRKQGQESMERSMSRFIAEMDDGGESVRHDGVAAAGPPTQEQRASGNARLAVFKALLANKSA